MAATSVHKLGGSMTQSSVLNVKGNRVNPKRIQDHYPMLTTTSTSYISAWLPWILHAAIWP